LSKKTPLLMIPGPTNVPDRVMNAMQRPVINHKSEEFRELHRSVIEGTKYAFQTQNDVFVLTCSGTGGIECAASNIVSPGDKVVVPVSGVFSQRLKENFERFGATVIEIPIEWRKAATPSQIREVVEREENVKAIGIVYNETSTGVTMRGLDEVGKIAEEHGALLVVDAISILGGDRLPVDEWKVDVCVTGSQKCIACPPGVVMVSVSERAWEIIAKSRRGSYYFDLMKCKEFQEKLETPYTPAIPLFYALDEALKMLKEEGLENRIKRHKVCADAFYDATQTLGLTFFADPQVRSNTVIAVNIPQGVEDKAWRDLMLKYGVAIGGGLGKLKGSIIRIGSMGIISKVEVNETVSVLGKSLAELWKPVDVDAAIAAAEKVFASSS